jgi:hypothetical protein
LGITELVTDAENISIAKYLLEYSRLVQAEADKLEILGIETTPSLFGKAQEIFYLYEQVNKIEAEGKLKLA